MTTAYRNGPTLDSTSQRGCHVRISDLQLIKNGHLFSLMRAYNQLNGEVQCLSGINCEYTGPSIIAQTNMISIMNSDLKKNMI